MMFYFKNSRLTRIPLIDILKIYCFSIIWGAWTVLKQVAKRIYKKKDNVQVRGNPPSCLTDSSLGQHSYIKLKGVKLHYVETGDRANEMVLLLHGFPDCWLTWRYQIPELSHYFWVVAVDLKGFGDSDKPESRASYNIEVLVKELHDFVHSLGKKSCVIIGHDIGGILGWYLMYFYPELITKFVALAAPHPNLYWDFIPNTSLFNERWIQFCQLPIFPEKVLLEEDLNIICKNYDYLNMNSVTRCYLEAYKYAFSRKEDWTGAINYFRTLPFWRVNGRNEGSLIPSLLVVGNKDTSVHMESIIKSSDYLEKSTLKVVDGASHHLHHQRPNEVNKLIVNFLIGPHVRLETKAQANGLVTRMFEAVSSTVKYGNGILDVVQKKTNGITPRVLYLGQSSS